ncbi:hypothetical protein CCO03_03755 [Comamonas serinivorans]|uniref:Uncharacterized protein n=1 Tax=Comamonas serinivorans TaxID=1082851 RepID=A0A1Y0EKT5_9BURK|nr:hypothetical protein CCO03_03755 [Comamonas serinivorans]
MTAKHGAKEGCRLAREKFPAVPHGTWGRWRVEAVGYSGDANAQTVGALAQQIRETIPAPEALSHVAGDPMPAVARSLRFWDEMDTLLQDADLLRRFALATGHDGALKVRVPKALVDAANMRQSLLKLALAQAEVAHGVQRAQQFFDAVIDAVGQESPECQRRIMLRLREVQGEAAARGF